MDAIAENLSRLLPALQGAVGQGVLWGIMVLGVYITFRLLDIADLTVDGSFALGGCVCALMLSRYHINPVLALAMSTLAGLAAGAVTGILHTVFEIPAILAGILSQIALWSINLRVLGNKSNQSIKGEPNLILDTADQMGILKSQAAVLIGVLVAVLIIGVLYWFFGTEIGSALRATGNNEDMIRALGVNTKMTKLLGLMISNGLVGLSGGLVCQSQGYGDINMGTGAIVIGLAAIVIGEVLLGWLRSFGGKLTSAVVGSVVYFLIRAIVLQLGMKANDMKLISAVIVALALAVPVTMTKWKLRQAYTEGGEEDADHN